MREEPRVNALESILAKLKEDTTAVEEFIGNEAIHQAQEKINKIIQNLNDAIKREVSSSSQIPHELENIRDYFTSYMYVVNNATKTYKTYIYALETLYNEYNAGANESTKIVDRTHTSENLANRNHTNQNLISEDMYNNICSRIKENGVTTISADSGNSIGIPRATFFRFVKVALLRGDIRKIGYGRYEIAGATDSVEERNIEEPSANYTLTSLHLP